MSADLYWSNTVLGLHFEGSHGSTTFADSKGHAVVANGNAIVSTAQAKYGTGSAYFDGAADWLAIPGSQDFVFGTGDFTIEAWIKTTDADAALVEFYLSGRATSWMMYMPAGKLAWITPTTAGLTSSASVNTGAWVHVAVTRASGVIRLFIDGVVNTATATDNTDYNTQQTWLALGAQVNTRNTAYDYLGYMDNVRITKGVARYVATFTPEDFTDNPAYFITGIVKDNVGNGTARSLRAYRRDTGAWLASTTSNVVTGEYTLEVPYAGEVQVIMLDDAAGSVENDQILRTTPL